MNTIERMSTRESSEIMIGFIDLYLQEYGHSKASTVHKKATNCNTLSVYLSDMVRKENFPNVDNILSCLNSSVYFAFAKSETVCCGALIALSYWYQMLGEVVTIDDRKMSKLVTDLIVKCQSLKVSHPNFFDKFYKVMNSLS